MAIDVFPNDETNEQLSNAIDALWTLNDWLGEQPDDHTLSINRTWFLLDQLRKSLVTLLDSDDGKVAVASAHWAAAQPHTDLSGDELNQHSTPTIEIAREYAARHCPDDSVDQRERLAKVYLRIIESGWLTTE